MDMTVPSNDLATAILEAIQAHAKRYLDGVISTGMVLSAFEDVELRLPQMEAEQPWDDHDYSIPD
jgi:hypothetical protein